MAKDPSINWYFDNWDGGTKLFSRHQKGCYMDLLSAQFHCGHLTLDNIKQILGSDFGEWEKSLKSKFETDENGSFFNERIEHEIEKRERFKEKQRANGLKGGRPKETQTKPKNNPTVNPNHNPNKSLYGTETETEIVYRIEDCLRIALNDSRWVNANKTEDAEVSKFNEYLEKQGIYEMNPIDYKRYFAKLKGKYPDLIKRVFTMDDYRRMAKEYDEMIQKQTA